MPTVIILNEKGMWWPVKYPFNDIHNFLKVLVGRLSETHKAGK